MPVVCDVCGTANRSKAKYCVGCAQPLAGFVPSGAAALDAVMAVRPAADAAPRGGGGGRAGAAVPVLPAETAAFWLKAGCVGLVMVVGFAAWCFHVTQKPGAPSLREQILALVVPESPPPKVLPAPPTPPVASAPTPAVQDTRLNALGIDPAGGGALPADSAARPVQAAAPQAASPNPPPAMSPRPAARPRTAVASSRRSPVEVPPPGAAERAPSRVDPDPGPPLAPGPGPLYDRGQPPSQRFADDGPPVVPGPGPLYNFSRPAVRAPSTSIANDLGPPIAAGPGPQFDYSTRGAAR